MIIKPNWPAPRNIKAFSTTRKGGVSLAPCDTLNLALHVNDDESNVLHNRLLIQAETEHPTNPHWLTQTHSDQIIAYNDKKLAENADGVFAKKINQACVVMTADCLPVLLASKSGDFVAAIHAGWRGLADGILIKGAKKYSNTNELLAWVGPAISQKHFQVGQDVHDVFVNSNNRLGEYFENDSKGKYLCDFAGIAESQLVELGITVYKSELCTYSNSQEFFSYRRDGDTGRMASMIWIEESL